MALTYTLIASNTLASSAAAITFSSIPSTYTDLVLRFSARIDAATLDRELRLIFNSDTTTLYSDTVLRGTSATVTTFRDINATYTAAGRVPGSTTTSNTFNNVEIYIPRYTVSQNKTASVFSAREDNIASPSNYAFLSSDLYRSTTAISSIEISPTADNFVSGSSFWLYGIKKD
jgi:hypothetical protein